MKQGLPAEHKKRYEINRKMKFGSTLEISNIVIEIRKNGLFVEGETGVTRLRYRVTLQDGDVMLSRGPLSFKAKDILSAETVEDLEELAQKWAKPGS